MLVEHVAHDGQVLDVVVVPKPCGDTMRVVRLGRDRAVLGTAGAVAALGLQRAEIRLAERLLRPEAVAMRDLVEAVLHRLGPELDRLEEDVVFRVARHRAEPPCGRGRVDSTTAGHALQVGKGGRSPPSLTWSQLGHGLPDGSRRDHVGGQLRRLFAQMNRLLVLYDSAVDVQDYRPDEDPDPDSEVGPRSVSIQYPAPCADHEENRVGRCDDDNDRDPDACDAEW